MSALRIISLVVALMIALPAFGFAQAEPTQEAQPEYTAEEYEAYQQAVSAEPGAREDTILAFIQANPQSALNQYAIGEYNQLLNTYSEQGQWQNLAQASDKLLAADAQNVAALYFGTLANYQLQQYDKAIEYGEKLSSLKPDVINAFMMAMSYRALKNHEKYNEWGEKAIATTQPAEHYFMIPEFMNIYNQAQNWNKAADYAQKTLDILAAVERPASSSEQEWNQYLNQQSGVAHAILGKRAFDAGRWTTAISNYDKAVGFLSGNGAFKSEAYFHIAMAQWKLNQIDRAMKSFAISSVQASAPHAKQSRQYLETLYKSTHNGALDGLDEFINGATGR
ncbi:MAG: tetratricopeptide repeat protein [Acidobacteriota bacterium]